MIFFYSRLVTTITISNQKARNKGICILIVLTLISILINSHNSNSNYSN